MEESGGFHEVFDEIRNLETFFVFRFDCYVDVSSLIGMLLVTQIIFLDDDAIRLRAEIIDEELLLLLVFCAAVAAAEATTTDDTDEIACIVFSSSLASC